MKRKERRTYSLRERMERENEEKRKKNILAKREKEERD